MLCLADKNMASFNRSLIKLDNGEIRKIIKASENSEILVKFPHLLALLNEFRAKGRHKV